MVPVAEATVMLTNLLSAAALTCYQSSPPKDSDKAVSFKFADGSVGWFVASRGRDTASADDYAGAVIKEMSARCQGAFLSGKQSIPSVDGSVVRKVITTCRNEGSPAVVVETNIVRREDGLLIDISNTVPDEPAPAEGQPSKRTQGTSLVDAALRSTTP